MPKNEMQDYYIKVVGKVKRYTEELTDEELFVHLTGCKYTKFTMLLAQLGHLQCHIGMVMGFIVDDTGFWPRAYQKETVEVRRQ